MAEVSVKDLAVVVGASVDRLLKQMQEAGLPQTAPDQQVTDSEKQRLLVYLKGLHGEQARDPTQITLKRKSMSTLKVGAGRKTVNVEIRKKRTYIKVDADGGETGADASTDVGGAPSGTPPVTPLRPSVLVDDAEIQRQAAISARRRSEEDSRRAQEPAVQPAAGDQPPAAAATPVVP